MALLAKLGYSIRHYRTKSSSIYTLFSYQSGNKIGVEQFEEASLFLQWTT